MKKKIFYKEGFFTRLSNKELPYGISENIIKMISEIRKEPKWMLDFRLYAYSCWLKMKEPHWLKAKYKPIEYKNYIYYSAPEFNNKKNVINKSKMQKLSNTPYLTKEVKHAFNKLNVPLKNSSNIAVDAIFDSVSVSTTYSDILAKKGIIFCSFNEAVKKHGELVRKYLGSVVPVTDNFFAALNSAVASDGTFIYIPKHTRCPIELSTYFRINSMRTNQFERTILIADENSYVSYIEGCSAPTHSNNQLHAAVVEVILLNNAKVKYSTVQNWFSGNSEGYGGIFNFVTKRALCKGINAKMSWTQLETGAAITWKYPSVILLGKQSVGEFFSVALTNNLQQADTGTKMIHLGENTKSTIISKGISSGKSENTYRGLVKISKEAKYARNFTKCDSMIIGSNSSAHTYPSIKVQNNTAQIEHEASVSRIGRNQLLYCRQRGIKEDDAISMIVNGFCNDIFSKLPLEFAAEAKELLSINLENPIG